MKKGTKELLHTIIENQKLIMKALHINVSEKEKTEKQSPKKSTKNTALKKAAAVKKKD